jgi:hypothetical protein
MMAGSRRRQRGAAGADLEVEGAAQGHDTSGRCRVGRRRQEPQRPRLLCIALGTVTRCHSALTPSITSTEALFGLRWPIDAELQPRPGCMTCCSPLQSQQRDAGRHLLARGRQVAAHDLQHHRRRPPPQLVLRKYNLCRGALADRTEVPAHQNRISQVTKRGHAHPCFDVCMLLACRI